MPNHIPLLRYSIYYWFIIIPKSELDQLSPKPRPVSEGEGVAKLLSLIIVVSFCEEWVTKKCLIIRIIAY